MSHPRARCRRVHEGSCSHLSRALKHDEHADISKPSGENQEIDIDLMSSRTSMKTTRNTTQNALLRSLRDWSRNELENQPFVGGGRSGKCWSRPGRGAAPDPQRALTETCTESAAFSKNRNSERLQTHTGITVTVCAQMGRTCAGSHTLLSFSAIRS